MIAGLPVEMDVAAVVGSEDFTTAKAIEPLPVPVVADEVDDEAGVSVRPPVLHPAAAASIRSKTAIFFNAANNLSITISLVAELVKLRGLHMLPDSSSIRFPPRQTP
jgi:hypothetical protein